jgi:hypothetical protein
MHKSVAVLGRGVESANQQRLVTAVDQGCAALRRARVMAWSSSTGVRLPLITTSPSPSSMRKNWSRSSCTSSPGWRGQWFVSPAISCAIVVSVKPSCALPTNVNVESYKKSAPRQVERQVWEANATVGVDVGIRSLSEVWPYHNPRDGSS